MEDKLQEKYIASLIGCATGDALGMPVEGWKPKQIKAQVGRVDEMMNPVIIRDKRGALVVKDEYGKYGYYTIDFRKGEYTDDTILSLALAESIVACSGLDLEDAARKQLEEYTARKQPDGRVIGGFGGTTRKGFENLLSGMSAEESGVTGGPGNAPAMKISPLGLYMDATGKYEEGLQFAEAVGKITHLDPRSVASGIVQAHAVYSVLQGKDRLTAAAEGIYELRAG